MRATATFVIPSKLFQSLLYAIQRGWLTAREAALPGGEQIKQTGLNPRTKAPHPAFGPPPPACGARGKGGSGATLLGGVAPGCTSPAPAGPRARVAVGMLDDAL